MFHRPVLLISQPARRAIFPETWRVQDTCQSRIRRASNEDNFGPVHQILHSRPEQCIYRLLNILCLVWTFCCQLFAVGAPGVAAVIFPAFWLNHTWTFKSGVSVKTGLPRYTGSTLFIFAIHSSTQCLSTEVLLVPEVLSQLVGICVTTIINFSVVRRFVFN